MRVDGYQGIINEICDITPISSNQCLFLYDKRQSKIPRQLQLKHKENDAICDKTNSRIEIIEARATTMQALAAISRSPLGPTSFAPASGKGSSRTNRHFVASQRTVVLTAS